MQIDVTTLIVTYNHENFIAQAIEGALNQKTTFPHTIFLTDDCSYDRTADIAREYAHRFPDRIKCFIQTTNLRQQKKSNFVETLSHCKSKYIAWCEGDDFWEDPLKLQTQVEFLEANPDAAGCFHDARLVDEEGRLLRPCYHVALRNRYNQEQALRELRSGYATCSLVFRLEAVLNLPDWFLKRPSDEAFDLVLTEHGDLAHIRKNMSAYRIHAGGVWQGATRRTHLEEQIERCQIFLENEKFRRLYSPHLYSRIFLLYQALLRMDAREMIKYAALTIRSKISLRQRGRSQN